MSGDENIITAKEYYQDQMATRELINQVRKDLLEAITDEVSKVAVLSSDVETLEKEVDTLRKRSNATDVVNMFLAGIFAWLSTFLKPNP